MRADVSGRAAMAHRALREGAQPDQGEEAAHRRRQVLSDDWSATGEACAPTRPAPFRVLRVGWWSAVSKSRASSPSRMRATMHEVPAGSEAPRSAGARSRGFWRRRLVSQAAVTASARRRARVRARRDRGVRERRRHRRGAHPDGAEPAAYFRALATHPVLCCSAFGACNFFFFALTLLLTAVGMAPFDMTAMNEGNTGLTLPYDEWSERASGFLRAQNEANFAVAGLYCPRSDIDYTMQFILQHTDGANLLTKDGLSYLKNSVEAHIVTDAAWPGLCVLLYDGECEVAPLMGIPTPYGTYDITDEHGCLQMTSPALLREVRGRGF